jgi:hypothetical protein
MPHSHLHRSHHFLSSFGELHVIVVCFNPHRFISRYTLAREFIERARAAGATASLAEVAFGERPYELCGLVGDRLNQVALRSSHELWLKECIINAAVARLPHDWKYVAWVDADVAFTNPHWVQETIQQLQHHPVVQMFHTALDLSPDNLPIGVFKGFPASVLENGWAGDGTEPEIIGTDAYGYYTKTRLFHPGYAWACRRDAWDAFGGLLDINIVGGGDRQMAYGFYGRMHDALFDGASAGYREAVLAWQEHALALKQNVGFVPGTLLHYWHGKKVNRRYFDRWKVLANNDFDPRTDLKRDWHGLWQLAGNKIGLRDDLMAYFRSRQEDSIDR